ncbi:MAG: HEAT repeat domain-containing protein [Desulfobacterales bacterium]
MANTDIRQKALDALVILNTAIKNVRLYPPSSSNIISTIERLDQAFQEILALEHPVIFAELEKIILICGNPLNQKDQEKTQVAAFLNILLGFGLKSISFEKGLEKAELAAFTEILSRKPDLIKSEGGLARVLAENNITHIYTDQKVYMAVHKDSKTMPALDISNDLFARFFMSTHPGQSADPGKLKEMVKDPEWLSQSFHAGLIQLMVQKGTLPDIQITEKLGNMIGLLDKVSGSLEQEERESISKRIGEDIVKADPGIASGLTTQKMEHLFGGMFTQYLIGKLEDIKYAGAKKSGDGTAPGKIKTTSGETVLKTRLIQISEKLCRSLKENEKTLFDEPLMSALPKIIGQLIAQKEHEAMKKVISNLIDKLFSKNAEVRARAAKILTDIIESLPQGRKTEIIESASGRLIEWIKIETSVTPAYKTICKYLQSTIQGFISQHRYAETIQFLDILNDINSGMLEKNDSIREICAQLISNLATEENITLLFKEFHTNEHDKKDEAGKILSRFGDITLKCMLDNLMESSDGNERVRIMQLIIGTGQRAIPLVMERIRENVPWYYLRNIAYILGQIGNEESAEALQPFLHHENERLRLEALKSISRTGGNRRGRLLIAALNSTDEKFKLSVIEALGNAKASDIVPDLMNILKTRPFVTTAARILMEENICAALGAIGSTEAIPVLSEIAETKSFFTISTYPEKVKVAAARALESIRKKQAESPSGK